MSDGRDTSTPEERLLAGAREALAEARRISPSSVEPGGLFAELAEAVRAYDDDAAGGDEEARRS